MGSGKLCGKSYFLSKSEFQVRQFWVVAAGKMGEAGKVGSETRDPVKDRGESADGPYCQVDRNGDFGIWGSSGFGSLCRLGHFRSENWRSLVG